MFYVYTKWFQLQYVLTAVKFKDVVHFAVNGFKIGMYSVMMTWLYQNMLE
jgi:hypothetical protein